MAKQWRPCKVSGCPYTTRAADGLCKLHREKKKEDGKGRLGKGMGRNKKVTADKKLPRQQ